MDNTFPCCQPLDTAIWQDKTVSFDQRRFVKVRVRSFLHMPLNMGAVITKTMKAIQDADAMPQRYFALSDECSLWGADMYVEVTKDVPGMEMATVSGTFLSRVYEGPYKNMGTWIKDMQAYVAASGKTTEKLLFYYTTCPKCAKKFGKNYVVIFAQV